MFYYSYRLLFMNRNHSLGYDPVASFGDCRPRFKSKRGKENAKGLRKKPRRSCAEKRDMDEGRQRSRTRPGRHCGKPARRNRRNGETGGRKTERGSRAKAAAVRKPLSSALPSDEIVGNRDFPVCRRVTECRFEAASRLPRKIGQRARIEGTSGAERDDGTTTTITTTAMTLTARALLSSLRFFSRPN